MTPQSYYGYRLNCPIFGKVAEFMDERRQKIFKKTFAALRIGNFGLMISLRALVVDDDPLIGDLIKHFCSKTAQIEFCVIATNATDGLNLLTAGGLDVVFLDYHLPDMKGQEFLERMPQKIPVIMVTSESEFAAKSYEYEFIVDFLVKPLSFDRFLKSLQRLSSASSSTESTPPITDFIFVKDGTRWVKIELDQLAYIKSEGNYSNFFTDKGHTLSLITMKELESKLPATFIRVHRSYIVNAKKIQMIHQDEVTVQGKELPVGDKYKAELLKWVKEL